MTVTTTLSDDKNELRIKIKGRFDFSLHGDFRKAYKDVPMQGRNIIVDLMETEYLDSSALGMLLLLKEYADEKSCRITIVNSKPEIREILQIASFDKLFNLA